MKNIFFANCKIAFEMNMPFPWPSYFQSIMKLHGVSSQNENQAGFKVQAWAELDQSCLPTGHLPP